MTTSHEVKICDGTVVRRKNGEDKTAEANPQKWYEDIYGWVMVVAVQVAAMAYGAGLNPPGGFWQDEKDSHEAGSSILHDKHYARYMIFFYTNATAFMASLVITILIMNKDFYLHQNKVYFLHIIMVLDLVSMIVAYAAGCARSFRTSIYLIVLAAVVMVVVIYSAEYLNTICKLVLKIFPCLKKYIDLDPQEGKQGEKNNPPCRCGQARENA
jgi:Domain of unknown function